MSTRQMRLWIGGPAGAGKSTIARLLARRHGTYWYSIDARTWSHEDRAVMAGIHRAGSGPGTYDRIPMIDEDLRGLGPEPVIIEGAIVTPENVPSLDDAIWLMPSKEEQLRRLEVRHPEGIHDGFLYGWEIISQALSSAQTSPRCLTVDGQTVDETLSAVEGEFRSLLAGGAAAKDVRRRRELVRWSNQAIYDHAKALVARGFQSADALYRDFDCECAEVGCTALVRLAMLEASNWLDRSPGAVVAH